PKDPIEAEEMLKTLMGKTHSVITAFCIIEAKSGKALVRSVESRVTIKNLSQEEISAYIESKEPFDKAGAYAVQEKGGMFVEKVEGSYTNVVGLPMDEVRESFEKLGALR
ncbi:MAG: Maf family protein, partial [Deltaproteobacteria bacterium]